MLTVLDQMIEVCDFLKKEVCDKITLYVPPEGDVIDDAYIADPVMGHPEIFPLTFDSNVGEGEYDENGNPITTVRKQAPAICVRITEGSELIDGRERNLTINLLLQSWNPGIFTKGGLYIPHDDDTAFAKKAYKDETKSDYIRNFDGWKESMTFLDIVIRAIEKADIIGDMQVVHDEPILFGPWLYEGEFIRWYPYWLSTITFKLRSYQRPLKNSDSLLD